MLSYRQGKMVNWRGKKYKITRVIDLSNCLAISLDDNSIERLPIKELSETEEVEPAKRAEVDLFLLSEKEIEVANKRYQIIKPLLDLGEKRSAEDVKNIAKNEGLSYTTLYRWINRYLSSGKISSLINFRRTDKGSSRIEVEQEEILKLVISENYLKDQRPSVEAGWGEYKDKCNLAGVKPCSKSTFARRVALISPQEKALRRKGPKAAHEKYDPALENFPHAKFPNKAIQIDHTQPNVILVDDVHRKPIGRPWLTLAIDIFSRMIVGFYLSFSPPSAFSVGMCLTFAMCRKEMWLTQRGLDVEYPVWGLFDQVFADNGRDFKCQAVTKACCDYSIGLTWRPLGRPEYGGHIERLIRTVKTDLANLKGTTFKNPEDRGEYDSEGRAVFTFSEFERWLTVYICKYYHKRTHSHIEMPPLKKYEEGLLGYGSDSIGLPDPIADERRLYLDFLPYVERTIPRSGVLCEHIRYFHPSIAKWINVKPPYGDKHIFKFEEHQISHLYYLDPDTNDYLEIPRVRRDAPQMTRFELRAANRRAKEKTKSLVDEQALIEAHRELKHIEAESTEKTKSVRRNKQRVVEAARARAHIIAKPEIPEALKEFGSGFQDNAVDAYEDIEA